MRNRLIAGLISAILFAATMVLVERLVRAIYPHESHYTMIRVR
jgi:hypothetical protein